jgi:ubiquinone/menaquinone biosynthesis C-methylase UbiE
MTLMRRALDCLTGKGRERLSNFGFHAMALIMKVTDTCTGYSAGNFKTLGLVPGQTVIDYGCGSGRYLKQASAAVGKNGRVIAVDIHPIAVKKAEILIQHHDLANVTVVFADGYATPLDDGIADIVYALEVFHMIEDPKSFLAELSRLVKKDGIILLEDGHQPRAATIRKIKAAGNLSIQAQARFHVRCRRQS